MAETVTKWDVQSVLTAADSVRVLQQSCQLGEPLQHTATSMTKLEDVTPQTSLV